MKILAKTIIAYALTIIVISAVISAMMGLTIAAMAAAFRAFGHNSPMWESLANLAVLLIILLFSYFFFKGLFGALGASLIGGKGFLGAAKGFIGSPIKFTKDKLIKPMAPGRAGRFIGNTARNAFTSIVHGDSKSLYKTSFALKAFKLPGGEALGKYAAAKRLSEVMSGGGVTADKNSGEKKQKEILDAGRKKLEDEAERRGYSTEEENGENNGIPIPPSSTEGNENREGMPDGQNVEDRETQERYSGAHPEQVNSEERRNVPSRDSMLPKGGNASEAGEMPETLNGSRASSSPVPATVADSEKRISTAAGEGDQEIDRTIADNHAREQRAAEKAVATNYPGAPEGTTPNNIVEMRKEGIITDADGNPVSSFNGNEIERGAQVLAQGGAIAGVSLPASFSSTMRNMSDEEIDDATLYARRRWAEGMSESNPNREKFMASLKDQHGNEIGSSLPDEIKDGTYEPVVVPDKEGNPTIIRDDNGGIISTKSDSPVSTREETRGTVQDMVSGSTSHSQPAPEVQQESAPQAPVASTSEISGAASVREAEQQPEREVVSRPSSDAQQSERMVVHEQNSQPAPAPQAPTAPVAGPSQQDMRMMEGTIRDMIQGSIASGVSAAAMSSVISAMDDRDDMRESFISQESMRQLETMLRDKNLNSSKLSKSDIRDISASMVNDYAGHNSVNGESIDQSRIDSITDKFEGALESALRRQLVDDEEKAKQAEFKERGNSGQARRKE